MDGHLFWVAPGQLGVFDPNIVGQLERKNSDGLTMPQPTAFGLGFNRNAPKIFWQDVRAALIERAVTLNSPRLLKRLYERMSCFAGDAADRDLDLMWFIQRLVSRSLIPLILDGLSPSERLKIVRDQECKLEDLLGEEASKTPRRDKIHGFGAQMAAGFAVRKALKARALGRRQEAEDMAQALMPMIDRLSYVRATYAVTTLLTAVAGAPGSVGACLMCELETRPAWKTEIGEELAALDIDALCTNPLGCAPKTSRFIREILRLWTFPLMASRRARQDIVVGDETLRSGQAYLLSPYITHRNPAHWADPEHFDPDRWIRREQSAIPGAYVPFGWSPRTCIGASVGLSQLVLLCHLLTSRFRLELAQDARPTIRLGNIAVPRGFNGRLVSRS